MDRKYTITERAHFMCPDMNSGILLRLNCKFPTAQELY